MLSNLELYIAFCIVVCPFAWHALYTYLDTVRYSNRKIGGIRFLKVNRLSVSFCLTKEA